MTPGTAPPSVTLYGHWSCPFVHRVAWALATRGIDHDTVEVPPSAMRPADFVVPSEFVEHSPRREIPMLRIGDEYLADSLPILEWLDASVGGGERLLPDEPVSAARVRSRVAWIDVAVFRPMIGVYYGTDPDRIAAASEALSAALVEVAAWLDDAPWLAGPRPTLADAAFVPFLVRLDLLRALGFSDRVPVALVAYATRVASAAGWAAVAWTSAQSEEMVGRFRARRRKLAGGV